MSTSHRAGPREWGGLAVLSLPTALLGLDVTLLYLALPSMVEDLRPSGTEALWIMDAYGFLIAGFLVTMGTLGDRVGRRRLLLTGVTAFAAVSVVAAFATSAPMLIAARAALGIAGATLMPSTLALVGTMFTDARRRSLAIGVWAMSFALGMAAGPLVGGALLAHFWWGSAFLLAVPVAAVTLAAAPRLVPEYRSPRGGRLDLPSVALSLAATLPLIYAVKHVAEHGPGVPALAAALAGTVCAVLFVRRQRGLESPLLDLTLFHDRTFTAALAILLVGLVGVGGVLLLVTQQLQFVNGLSPTEAGAWMGPPALMMLVAAVGSPLAARRVPPGVVVAAALALSALGYALLAQVDATDGVAPTVIGFGLVYLGLGTIAALGTDLVVGAAPPDKAGSASALSETVQELGVALGVATLGSLAAAVYRDRVDEAVPAGTPADVAGPVRDSLAGASSVRDRLPPGLLDRAGEAATHGLNAATLAAAIGVLALAALSALALRHTAPITETVPHAEDAAPTKQSARSG